MSIEDRINKYINQVPTPKVIPIRFDKFVEYNKGKIAFYICRCDCGKEKSINILNIVDGKRITKGGKPKSEAWRKVMADKCREKRLKKWIGRHGDLEILKESEWSRPGRKYFDVFCYKCNRNASVNYQNLNLGRFDCGCTKRSSHFKKEKLAKGRKFGN